jgi:hypothetical protein
MQPTDRIISAGYSAPSMARRSVVLGMPEWARWVIGIVLALIGLAALFWASRQDAKGQYLGVAITGLCYIGIMLQMKWAWDAREAEARRGAAPDH